MRCTRGMRPVAGKAQLAADRVPARRSTNDNGPASRNAGPLEKCQLGWLMGNALWPPNSRQISDSETAATRVCVADGAASRPVLKGPGACSAAAYRAVATRDGTRDTRSIGVGSQALGIHPSTQPGAPPCAVTVPDRKPAPTVSCANQSTLARQPPARIRTGLHDGLPRCLGVGDSRGSARRPAAVAARQRAVRDRRGRRSMNAAPASISTQVAGSGTAAMRSTMPPVPLAGVLVTSA